MVSLGGSEQPMQVSDATSYFNKQSACSKENEQQKRQRTCFPFLN
jgi:hypothetical protein